MTDKRKEEKNMKYKATKKEVKSGYHRIIGISYCNAQYLLKYHYAESYCAGVYGWSCDNYNIDGVCISTGYNYINSKNTLKDNYDIVRKYELEAQKVECDNRYNWESNKVQINKLLHDMIKELTDE